MKRLENVEKTIPPASDKASGYWRKCPELLPHNEGIIAIIVVNEVKMIGITRCFPAFLTDAIKDIPFFEFC